MEMIRRYSTKLTDYEILDIISKGRSSQLHRAIYKPLDSFVCVRIFDLEKFYGSELDNVLGMLSNEIRVMKVCHTNITQYYSSFIEGSRLFIVLDYLAGSIVDILKYNNREEYMKNDTVFVRDPELLRFILFETLLGIENCHKNGIMHQNVKGDYILVSRDGEIKLSGFYRASFFVKMSVRRNFKMEDGRDMDITWTAPEILEQNNDLYDEKVDIWSLGISILELVYGNIPFKNRNKMYQHGLYAEIITEPSLELKDDEGTHIFCPQLKEVVDLCLKKKPDERPTATQLLEHKYFKNQHQIDSRVRQKYIRRTLKLRTLPFLPDRNLIMTRLKLKKKLLEKESSSINNSKNGDVSGSDDRDLLLLRHVDSSESLDLDPYVVQSNQNNDVIQFNFDRTDDDKIMKELEEMATPIGPSSLPSSPSSSEEQENNTNSKIHPEQKNDSTSSDSSLEQQQRENDDDNPINEEEEEENENENPNMRSKRVKSMKRTDRVNRVLLAAVARLHHRKKLENEVSELKDENMRCMKLIDDLRSLVQKQKELIEQLKKESRKKKKKKKKKLGGGKKNLDTCCELKNGERVNDADETRDV